MLGELENLPRLELTSILNNITNLAGWDIDIIWSIVSITQSMNLKIVRAYIN
jgi:hypothetical protein